MKSFLNKLKNDNKAMGTTITGMITLLIFLVFIAHQVDVFFAVNTKAEIQTNLELAQLYSLIKAVDVEQSRDGKLVVNEGVAHNQFRRHFFEHHKEGQQIKEFVTPSNSQNFIKYGVREDESYMFDDNRGRRYVFATSKIQYVPRRMARKDNRPIELFSTTRLFLE